MWTWSYPALPSFLDKVIAEFKVDYKSQRELQTSKQNPAPTSNLSTWEIKTGLLFWLYNIEFWGSLDQH